MIAKHCYWRLKLLLLMLTDHRCFEADVISADELHELAQGPLIQYGELEFKNVLNSRIESLLASDQYQPILDGMTPSQKKMCGGALRPETSPPWTRGVPFRRRSGRTASLQVPPAVPCVHLSICTA